MSCFNAFEVHDVREEQQARVALFNYLASLCEDLKRAGEQAGASQQIRIPRRVSQLGRRTGGQRLRRLGDLTAQAPHPRTSRPITAGGTWKIRQHRHVSTSLRAISKS